MEVDKPEGGKGWDETRSASGKIGKLGRQSKEACHNVRVDGEFEAKGEEKRYALKDVRVQLVPDADELQHDQQAAQREHDQRVDKAAREGERADARRTHAAEKHELRHVVHRLGHHEVVQLARRLGDRNFVVDDLGRVASATAK